jgi:site-specific recombinase XerD
MEHSALTVFQFTLESAVTEWLEQKMRTKSGSEHTLQAYRSTLEKFRAQLQQGGLDLLCPSDDPEAIKRHAVDVARVATLWASLRHPDAKRGHSKDGVADATYNQRLACISSFYTFLQKKYKLALLNPIQDVDKRSVQEYKQARSMSADEIIERLERIDTTTLKGKRDLTVLSVGLMTGRRAQELMDLQLGHVQLEGNACRLIFEHCKGDKVMRDLLDPDTSALLLDYVHSFYGHDWQQLAGSKPLWVSLANMNYGKQITTHTLNDICETYLGTAQIHTLRHTFVMGMMDEGATLAEIQDRLGHERVTTTARYVKALGSDKNKYSAGLAKRFGISKRASAR